MARKAATVRMPTCAQTANKASPAGDPAEAGFTPPAEAGFTLVEMLVAMLILSLVGLTLARFQTFQMHSTASLAMGAAGKLAADNLAIDLLVAPAAPTTAQSGVAEVGGRPWYWQVTPAPPPDPRERAAEVPVHDPDPDEHHGGDDADLSDGVGRAGGAGLVGHGRHATRFGEDGSGP